MRRPIAYFADGPREGPCFSSSDARNALREHLAPSLRRRGFKGSVPHFYREHNDGLVDFLSVQFSKFGNAFAVNISTAKIDRDSLANIEARSSAAKLRAAVAGPSERSRLGSELVGRDCWYNFAAANTPSVDADGFRADPEALATLVAALAAIEGECFWRTCRAEARSRAQVSRRSTSPSTNE